MALAAGQWSAARAREWAKSLPVLAGCNYVPASAVNQIEMWSEATWDPERIGRELGAARDVLGYNALRVYLHDAVWEAEGEAFLDRIDSFLAIADARGFSTLLVFFDDCWHEPRPNPQGPPVPGVHNSGWARSPGKAKLLDRDTWPALELYVRAVVRRFAGDPRVLGWDIYNEIGNTVMPQGLSNANRDAALTTLRSNQDQLAAALDLAEAACAWVRDEAASHLPSQPLTIGVYQESDKMGVDSRVLPLCDVVSFHHYEPRADLQRQVERLSALGRPLMCTEYLNRVSGATVESHLSLLTERRIPAFAWGLVDGKTQTKFSWTDRPGAGGEITEPDPWFHDTLRADLSAYDPAEARLAKSLIQRQTAEEAPHG